MLHAPRRRDPGGWASSRDVTRLVVAGAFVAIAAGCSNKPARVTAPPINASRAAAEAIRLCDRDGNGEVSPAEAAASPGLAAAFERVDTNHDGSLSAEEITARIADWASRRVGIVAQPVQITWNGKPLADGRAEFIPEPYLARWLKPARADIFASGICNPSLPPEDLPKGLRTGINCGFYTVRITHPTLKVPPRYNEQSTLGIEIVPNADPFHPPHLDLKASAADR